MTKLLCFYLVRASAAGAFAWFGGAFRDAAKKGFANWDLFALQKLQFWVFSIDKKK